MQLANYRAKQKEGLFKCVMRGARGQVGSVVPNSAVVGGSKAGEISQVDEAESLVMD